MGTPRVVKAGDLLGGKFRVERVLGAGGMGVVVAARHTELGQLVALKLMLKDALQDGAGAERFAREARSAVRLQSAHTARVLDVGQLKTGEPYMVMEYLEGMDLDAALQAHGPFAPNVAVDYILQASEAFAEAHGLGMVHRDIKLKNLFLTRTVDGRPFVKVLDFGLAKTIGSMGDISLTATSAVFGSPQYMSPEQMRSAKDVDARSDIWSLGVCLYELLTGRVPFDASGLAEICAMVLKDPTPPLSTFVTGLPPDLEAAVMRCLEKDPANRFSSVAELAVALEPFSDVEGSARRILHVMQSVPKNDLPTIPTDGPEGSNDAGPKTIDAWDSGEQRRGSRSPSRSALAALAVVGVAGVLLAVVLVLAFARSSRTPPTLASAAPDPVTPSAVVAATAPPETAATVATTVDAGTTSAATAAAAAVTTAKPVSPPKRPPLPTPLTTPRKPTPGKFDHP